MNDKPEQDNTTDQSKPDHSRFADIFGDGSPDWQQPTDDVDLDNALRANKRPTSHTEIVKVYDDELGWVDEYVTVEDDPEATAAFEAEEKQRSEERNVQQISFGVHISPDAGQFVVEGKTFYFEYDADTQKLDILTSERKALRSIINIGICDGDLWFRVDRNDLANNVVTAAKPAHSITALRAYFQKMSK